MTDEQVIRVLQKILQRQRAGEFGKVAGMAPQIHVHFDPFSVTIGEVRLSQPKVFDVAAGLLRIEPQALGWVLCPVTAPKKPATQSTKRKLVKVEAWRARRSKYLAAKS